jgi:putative phage-type endonuclease
VKRNYRWVVSKKRDGEAAWLKARREYVTASDVAAVLKKSPYKKPLAVFYEKIHGDSVPTNHHMQRGIDNEERILNAFRREWAGRAKPVSGLAASERYPWLACSLDGLGRRDGKTYAVEVKCPAKSWTSPPDLYLIQLQAQMLVLGCDHGVLVWASPPTFPVSYIEVGVDTTLQKEIIKVTEDFKKCIDNETLSMAFW